MAETGASPARVHRVTTRRRTLRPLNCPLEAELLVAEFADELPPDVAITVREHVAVCETCGARSLALKHPYQLLASLGNESVPYVPDLRGAIQAKARAHPIVRTFTRATATLGRNGTIALTAIFGLGVLAVFITTVFLLPASAQTAPRSVNGLQHVPAAGSGGLLFAETGKLVTVTDRTGATWQVAEVIAADERSGAIARSLPASNDPLRVAPADSLPISIQMAANSIAELTAPNASQRQALVVFDAQTGKVRFVTPLALPGGKPLPGQAGALALAPDGTVAYIGLAQPRPTTTSARALVVDMKTGAVVRVLAPSFTATIPLPPPPGSLPASAFPSSIPHLNAGGMVASQGLSGALAISPDGRWLFDVVQLANGQGPQYVVIRRISVGDGSLAQELALPGTFTNARFAASLSASVPQVYLVRGTPNAECFVLDGSAQGPTLIGDIPLGGPAAPAGAIFTGSLVLNPSNTGTRLYITQDITQTNGRVSGHDLWLVDTQGMGLVAHGSDPIVAGALLPNTASGAKAGAFVLRDGQVFLTQANLTGSATPWIRLRDGHPVVTLLAVVGP
ncbi:MAG: hypothetical protein IVW57_04855 [Ktedonobacterales bacterium]|nr:hypothetical protein [Ktedonobacterales bacterium]